MAFFIKGMLVVAVAGRGADGAKTLLRQEKVLRDNHHHRVRVGCQHGTSENDCEVLMDAVIKEREKEEDADLKAGRHTRVAVKVVQKANSTLPGEGSPPDWWGEDEDPEVTATRLRDDCEEPDDPPDEVGGWGPEKVYCCHTAVALVQDLNMKKEHCDADPPVDCWKSLREVLPNYIAHYTKRRDWLCRTTTTTTLLTTAGPPSPAAGAPGPAPAGANGGLAPAPAGFGPDWCLELCKKHTEAEQADCKALCAAIYKKMVHKDECEEYIKEGGFPSAPAPSNK